MLYTKERTRTLAFTICIQAAFLLFLSGPVRLYSPFSEAARLPSSPSSHGHLEWSIRNIPNTHMATVRGHVILH